MKAQQTRNEDVQSLAGEMADMLEVVGELPSSEKIKSLQTTVTSMMAKIEECGDFINEFVGLGFKSMLSFAFYNNPSILNPYYSADGNGSLFCRCKNRWL